MTMCCNRYPIDCCLVYWFCTHCCCLCTANDNWLIVAISAIFLHFCCCPHWCCLPNWQQPLPMPPPLPMCCNRHPDGCGWASISVVSTVHSPCAHSWWFYWQVVHCGKPCWNPIQPMPHALGLTALYLFFATAGVPGIVVGVHTSAWAFIPGWSNKRKKGYKEIKVLVLNGSDIATTSVTNDLLWHWLMPSSHRLIFFIITLGARCRCQQETFTGCHHCNLLVVMSHTYCFLLEQMWEVKKLKWQRWWCSMGVALPQQVSWINCCGIDQHHRCTGWLL